jgi:hypothetical protein
MGVCLQRMAKLACHPGESAQVAQIHPGNQSAQGGFLTLRGSPSKQFLERMYRSIQSQDP